MDIVVHSHLWDAWNERKKSLSLGIDNSTVFIPLA